MADQTENPEDNVLLALIRQARIKGKSYIDIEAMHGIPAPRAEQMMKAYYANKLATVDPNEMRLLQLDRLEGLIDVLYSMAAMGNSKSAEVLLKTLEQINELLGLNLQVTRSETRIVTEDQTQVVYHMIRFMVKGLLDELIVPLVTNQKQLALIEDQMDDKVNDLFGRAVEVLVLPVVESGGK